MSADARRARSGGPLAAPDAPLAVVVVSHNKREATLACLASVARLEYRPRIVIVVDNASADGSADAIATAHPEVHLVRSSTNLGAVGGRNLGIRLASELAPGAHILFLDDDALADERLAGELMAALEADPRAGIVSPKAYRTGSDRILAGAGGMRVRLWRGHVAEVGAGMRDEGQFDQPALRDACLGYAFLLRREALAAVGGFDEAYNPYGWEEVDFSLRVREAGYHIRYVPTALAYHAGTAAGRGHRVPGYERGKAANFPRLMRRHATRGARLAFAMLLPLRALPLVAGAVRRGEWWRLREGVAGLLQGLRGTGA
ncbi:MAG TPA: glycosyltransferase family 2 protein [Gemmatimonadales bacterium]|nr:glycosyltransferase family 2 protein [Gemmatimonadales bacterium]